ncbi:DinB family protein [Sabulilitoribacter arenilitoris]|uniref:DinB family protein n=1 Tax=Wocania arenilitoris TaxID=2044858 RepID=A0AAE3EM42_9FLAO|nr:DinB family protein [Wocania arenilitoris]MCF7567931.1 DinB family protein [Wocania arenilitoris]
MNITSEALILELIKLTRQNINEVKQLNQKPINELNWKLDEKTWSVLETIEHLNLYGAFYLPEIEKCIGKSKKIAEAYYKPGALGNYFAKSMLPKEKLNKMNTFKSKNPNGGNLDKSVLEHFISQQEKTLILLNKARKVSLNKIRVPTTLGKLVKLKLGDTFRVVIYHNLRHIVQAKKIIEAKTKL